MSIALTRRLDKIETKLNVVNASTPISDSDLAILHFLDPGEMTLEEWQQLCINAMEHLGITLYDTVSYKPVYDISDDVMEDIAAAVEPPDTKTLHPPPPPETAPVKVVIEPMQYGAWQSGEPRQADEYDYEEYA